MDVALNITSKVSEALAVILPMPILWELANSTDTDSIGTASIEIFLRPYPLHGGYLDAMDELEYFNDENGYINQIQSCWPGILGGAAIKPPNSRETATMTPHVTVELSIFGMHGPLITLVCILMLVIMHNQGVLSTCVR